MMLASSYIFEGNGGTRALMTDDELHAIATSFFAAATACSASQKSSTSTGTSASPKIPPRLFILTAVRAGSRFFASPSARPGKRGGKADPHLGDRRRNDGQAHNESSNAAGKQTGFYFSGEVPAP